MPEQVIVDVEENDNCGYVPMLVFEARGEPATVDKVRLFEPDRPHGVYEVTGWSSDGGGTTCDAVYVPVSDSGSAESHLVYGGDWGVRLRPEHSDAAWDTMNQEQWGEALLMLSDAADVILRE